MYKIIISGSRHFSDYTLLKSVCNCLLKPYRNIQIVYGGANGADTLASQYAREMNHSLKLFSPNWNKYSRAAGPIRNKQMAEYSDGCIAFWDGKSPGTKHMISQAKKYNITVHVQYIHDLFSPVEE